MVKKALLVPLLLVLVVGGVFAQRDYSSMPKNTITVDVGPTIIGALFGVAWGMLGDALAEEGFGDSSSVGFGIGAQYERQLSSLLALTGRGAYLGLGLNLLDGTGTSIELDLKAISAETHFRFYPFGETFFLGAMAGYGNLLVGMTGKFDNQTVSFNPSRSFVRAGARLGWRIDFGNPGGFVFEPSFGYDHAFGLGDTFGTKLRNEVQNQGGGTVNQADITEIDDFFAVIANYIFIGGPRASLAFGWRF